MSIKVVCGCGACTLLPSEWAGKRVKCKCGRTFVVGTSDLIVADAPVTTPLLHKVSPMAAVVPPPVASTAIPAKVEDDLPEVPAPDPAGPADVPRTADPADPADPARPADPAGSAPAAPAPVREYVGLAQPAHVADTLHRGMHTSRVGPQALLAFVTVFLALTSLSAVLLVLRDHNWSLASMLGLQTDGEVVVASHTDDDPAQSLTAGTNDTGTGADSASSTGKTSAAGDRGAARLANLTELTSDDGLLLSGLFGDVTERLELTAKQQETIGGVVTKLKENEESLQSKKLTLEEWYAACHKLGDELLAVLTDAQRQKLQMLLERKEMQRVHLVEYAARFVPELAVALMPWSAQIAGRSFRVISESSFTAAAQDACCRASEPTGLIAPLAVAAADAPSKLTVWDLVRNRQESSVDIASPVADTARLLSRDGRHLVLVRPGQGEGAASVVEVWSAEAGKLLGSRELPTAGAGPYVVRDCVAHRVIALGAQGYWVWDYESDAVQETEFPESRPDAAPCLAISTDASHLIVAHVYKISAAPKERSLVEVCIYRMETGELLGNQVLHKDYLASSISAMALSHDGRELALLWDFGPENPTRRLVHMNARNGAIIKTVEGLPAADQGYARQHRLADRDLIWLPENGGWIVNLQHVVDAETAAILPLDLPAKVGAGSSGSAGSEIVEAVPAGDGRLLLILAERSANEGSKGKMTTEFIDLPKLGPFQ